MSDHGARDADSTVQEKVADGSSIVEGHAADSTLTNRFFADCLRASALEVPSVSLLVDTNCTILEQSEAAATLLCPPLPLTTRGGRLKVLDKDNARLFGTFMEGLGPLTKKLLLTSKDGLAWVLLRAKASQLGSRRVIFLDCILSLPLRSVMSSGLANHFGLTDSEAAVLDRFAHMERPRDIAEALDVSVSTVRSHLKQIHVKLNVHSNLQLLKLARDYCDN